MKLISNAIITIESVRYALGLNLTNPKKLIKEDLEKYAITDFKAGISFAEMELQNLAIEFSDWKDTNCTKQWSSKQGHYWTINGKLAMYFHNRELFIIFMEQRTK